MLFIMVINLEKIAGITCLHNEDGQKKKSLNKYTNFYKVVHALICKLEEKFEVCAVYDMKS